MRTREKLQGHGASPHYSHSPIVPVAQGFVMTALTTALALLPLIVRGNLPGQEIEYPMAWVIMGGLVTATLLNLFILPLLYLRVARPIVPSVE